MRDLAAWTSRLDLSAVPGQVQAAARRQLLDGLGCLISAVRRNEASAATQVAQGLGGPAEATLVGTTTRVGAPAAACGNAVALHALDFDDTHAAGLVHPTAVVAPTVLAVAEQTGATGAQLLAAYVAGVETICRLGAAAPHAFHARGVHATSACGTVAAAVTTARLLNLDEERTTDAIGIAASGASGLLEFLATGSSTKQLHPGFAAYNGILAARLAAAGATGPVSALDGERGLYRALAGRVPDRVALLGDLGRRWETAAITVKPYPACQLSHAAVTAAMKLRQQVDPGRITALRLHLHPDAVPIVGDLAPATAYAAKFSAAWCAAVALLDGTLPVEAFDRSDRPDAARLAARTTVLAWPADQAQMPAADAPARIEATMDADPARAPADATVDDGWIVADAEHGGGRPGDPGLDDLVRRKARAALGDRADAVTAAVDGLATAATVTDLMRSLA
ncbi:MmgE/PrpD family protein [Hamadaea sp. NPDC051192]|uniref:MmgE/PrpD family protein n=1 Tax=Hamadaea sp. NPDC051192 TaxID=3154940 RepID=UPI0034322A6E